MGKSMRSLNAEMLLISGENSRAQEITLEVRRSLNRRVDAWVLACPWSMAPLILQYPMEKEGGTSAASLRRSVVCPECALQGLSRLSKLIPVLTRTSDLLLMFRSITNSKRLT